MDEDGLEGPKRLANNKRDSSDRCQVVSDNIGDVGERQVDDMEVWREGGGLEELVLGGGGFGGDDNKTNLEAVVEDEVFGQLQERDDVAHTWAWEERHMGFQRHG